MSVFVRSFERGEIGEESAAREGIARGFKSVYYLTEVQRVTTNTISQSEDRIERTKQTDAHEKVRHLRRILESVMWEFMTVKDGRWEDLPEYTRRKEELLSEMKQYDWTPAPQDRDNPEVEIIKAQIVDLEYQTRKMLETQMSVIQTQMGDLERRTGALRSAVQPYLKNLQ